MKTIDEIIKIIENDNEIKNEVNNLINIIIDKYNQEIENIEDIDDDIKRGEILSQPLFTINKELFYLYHLIEQTAGINIKRYIESDEYKNDIQYNDKVENIYQFTMYLIYFISDNNLFDHIRYEDNQVKFYFNAY